MFVINPSVYSDTLHSQNVDYGKERWKNVNKQFHAQ